MSPHAHVCSLPPEGAQARLEAALRRLTMTTALVLDSMLTCPHCGHVKQEHMPTDACQFFYDCTGCGTMLRPKPGD